MKNPFVIVCIVVGVLGAIAVAALRFYFATTGTPCDGMPEGSMRDSCYQQMAEGDASF